MSFLTNISIARKLRRLILLISGIALLIASLAYVTNQVFSYRNTLLEHLSVLSDILTTQVSAAIASSDTQSA